MKKSFGLVLISSIFLAGCTLPGTTSPSIPQNKQDVQQELQAEKLGQILASGGSAECKITNLKDNTEIEYSVKGNKYKISGTDLGEGRKGMMIVDGKNTYTWQEDQKTGFRIPMSEEEVAKTSPEDATRSASSFEDETKYKMECSRKELNDDDFLPPSDVKFLDPGITNPGAIQNMVTR